MFSQLKEDYEELRKEKQGLYDQMETRLVQKEEEIKKINMERDDVTASHYRYSERT
jgi:hypothetical protein